MQTFLLLVLFIGIIIDLVVIVVVKRMVLYPRLRLVEAERQQQLIMQTVQELVREINDLKQELLQAIRLQELQQGV